MFECLLFIHDSTYSISLSRRDMTVEVVDKSRISQVKVATIEKIIGKRLQLRYYDSKPGSPEREYFGNLPSRFF